MEPQDGTGSEPTSELHESPELTTGPAEAATPGPADSAGASSQPATGINPAWTGLRDAIGEDHFETFARPILQEMDQSAQSRITDLNAKLRPFEGYQPFIDQGVAPDQMEQALQLAQMLESNPEQLYQFLSEHLQKGEPAPEEPEEPEAPAVSMEDLPPELRAQFEQMQAFQQQQAQFAQQQAYEAEVQAADKLLQEEADAFISANPTWTKEDLPELEEIRYQLTQNLAQQGHQRIASFDEAAQVLQSRISRYTQRGSSAPNTLPTTAGGNITATNTFDPAKASKKDFEDQIVADLQSLKATS